MAFSFGSTGGEPSASDASRGGFAFGAVEGGASAPAAAAAPAGGGFSFGSSTGGSHPEPLPAAGGFSFGASGGSAPSLAPSTGTTSAPATGFAFGSTANPATSAASSGASFSRATATTINNSHAFTTTSSLGNSATSAAQPTVVVPAFDDVFPRLQIWKEVKRLCSRLESASVGSSSSLSLSENAESIDLIGQELRALLGDHARTTLKPQISSFVTPDQTLRSNIQQKPLIGLDGDATKTRNLTAKNLHEMLSLATDLQISEKDAMTLYIQVASQLPVFQKLLSKNRGGAAGSSLLNEAFSPQILKQYSTEGCVAREVYFLEQHLQLQSLLFLVQMRLTKDPIVMSATDFLLSDVQCNLIPNLIQLVQLYTRRIRDLHTLVQNREVSNEQSTWQSGFSNASHDFSKIHLLFCQRQRQTAAEILFYIAYDTQLMVEELTSLIDVIRVLSDESPLPCPFTDVPSGYEPDGIDHHVYSSFASSRQEKDPLVWQKEFVHRISRSGQVQIMQCNSLLLMTAVAAMETQHTFHNRAIRGPNPFGVGNDLVPPNQSDLRHLLPLHDRLSASKANDWKRRDIWGVLAFSYALLLRSAPSAIMSPRMGGSGEPIARELREDAKDCLAAPLQAHSFTYCRLTLLPVLQRLKASYVDSRCNLSEFALALLSQVYSLYLTVVMDTQPRDLTSRKRWQSSREEQMKLEAFQLQQQQDIDNLAASFGGHTKSAGVASAQVLDLMDRPDCLDDLMALAAAISALGEGYSRLYLETSGQENGIPSPCTSLRECIQKASDDQSLLPTLVSWLASLVKDEKSALAVDQLLTPKNDSSADISKSESSLSIGTWIDWIVRLDAISVSIKSDVAPQASKTSAPPSSGMPSPYYYDLDGFTHGESTSSTSNSSSTTTSKSSKAKELSGVAKFEAISILALITNVCLHSAEVRYKILSLRFPPAAGQITGQGTALVVLFSFTIAPLTPQCRGAVLNAIASLFQPSKDGIDPQQRAILAEEGQHAWRYLEDCQILPIRLLDQYRVQAKGSLDNQSIPGMMQFPPSSKKLASIASPTGVVFAKDMDYQIVYEMEHIESKEGVYPSTEGFLELLRSLICSVGCPPNVGEGFRTRTGCLPYLEYVISFVLPRALGIDGSPALPFRLDGDQSRLCSKALEVIYAVLFRYDLSQIRPNRNSVEQSALSILGIQDVADEIIWKSPEIEPALTINDFRNSFTASKHFSSTSDSYSINAAPAPTGSTGARFPSAKSPGFAVLFHILSSSFGVLLKSIATVLTQNGGGSGVTFRYGFESDAAALAYALFGATPPSFQSAKTGDGPDAIYTNSRHELLAEMPNTMQTPNVDASTYDDAIVWRERSIEVALRILCVAIVKENEFVTALKYARDVVKMVPVLRFKNLASPTVEVIDINVSGVASLLFTVRNSASVRSAIVSYIGYEAQCDDRDKWISSYALSISKTMQENLPSNDLAALWGFDIHSALSLNVAKRLLMAGKRMGSSTDAAVVQMILLWILSELRGKGTMQENGLAQHLLGLPGRTNTQHNNQEGRGLDATPIDCLDAILQILMTSSISQLTSGSYACSSLAFEVLFRLCNLLHANDTFSMNILRYTTKRLREIHFWEESLANWCAHMNVLLLVEQPFSVPSQSQKVMHTLAWLLKGVACELRTLVGSTDRFENHASPDRYFLPPQPEQCNQLLSILLSQGAIMERLIDRLPLRRAPLIAQHTTPSQELLAVAVIPCPGPKEVVGGYELIDTKKIIEEVRRVGDPSIPARAEEILAWVDNWNTSIQCDCAVSHLSKAIATVFEIALSTAETVSLFQTAHSYAGNIPMLLVGILRQLHTNSGRAMDDDLSSSATRYLADAVLILTGWMTSRLSDRSPITNNFLQVACKISSCIQSSAMGGDTASDNVVRNERTVCLASALSLLIQRAMAFDPSALFGFEEEFVRAVQSLAPITCVKVDSGGTNSPQAASMLARSCVATIIGTFRERDDLPGQHPFVISAFSLPWVESLLRLVAELDTNVCSFLQYIALQRSGGVLLMSSGIGEALLVAAKTYMHYEGSKLVAAQQTGTTIDMVAPSFLGGHLQLVAALLALENIPAQTFFGFVAMCIESLGMYRPILSSLCGNLFPRQADLLKEFLKCLALIVSITNPISSNESNSMMSSQTQKLRESLSSKHFMEAGVAALLSTIWENPLPRDLQRSVQLPAGLIESANMKRYETFTWWDNLEVMLAAHETTNQPDSAVSFDAPSVHSTPSWAPAVKQTKKWNPTKFEYCIVSIKILSAGASILRRLNRLDLVDANSLARGICCCAHAAQIVTQRVQNVKRTCATSILVGGNNELECHYLEALVSALAESVEHEMLLAAMLTIGGSSSKENNCVVVGAHQSVERTLASAISVSGLLKDPQFFSHLTSSDAAEHAELLTALSKDIINASK